MTEITSEHCSVWSGSNESRLLRKIQPNPRSEEHLAGVDTLKPEWPFPNSATVNYQLIVTDFTRSCNWKHTWVPGLPAIPTISETCTLIRLRRDPWCNKLRTVMSYFSFLRATRSVVLRCAFATSSPRANGVENSHCRSSAALSIRAFG